MRLVTFRLQAEARLGVWQDNIVIDAQAAVQAYSATHSGPATDCPADMPGLLQSPEAVWDVLRRAVDWAVQSNRPGICQPANTVCLLAPIPQPGKVICIAGNYPASSIHKKPDYPIIFLKPSGTITGPNMPILLAQQNVSVAYEVELALVVGQYAHNVNPSEAMDCLAGFTIANDVGDRVLEKRTSQWTSGKMFDTFTPTGPWLVTCDEIPEPGCLKLHTEVNGQRVQQGNTADMFFSIPELVSLLSGLTTLQPGDLILTGSPKMMAGSPNPVLSLQPGDEVTVSVEGIGALTNPVRKEA